MGLHADEATPTGNLLVRVDLEHNGRSKDASTPWVRIPIPPGESPNEAYERLQLSSGIAEVSFEWEYSETASPDDPWYLYQWHLRAIGVEDAWNLGTGSGVTVAVLDSGVSTGGSDLLCHSFVHPYNAFTGSTDLSEVADDTGHGTHVTGTIAQCTNNGVGAAGVAPDASIMPIKVLEAGTGTSLEVANGILWAVDQGADVVNLSLGRACSEPWPACSDLAVDSAVEYANDAGVLIVAASGNEGAPWVSSPANHPLALAIGATTTVDTIASYSNRGSAIDLVAPGGNTGDLDGDLLPDGIYQEAFDGSIWGITERRGTSSATPHVSGTAALLLSINGSLTVEDVKAILSSTAVDLGPSGWDSTFGAGRLDASAAAAAVPPPPPPAAMYVLGGPSAVTSVVADDIAEAAGTTPSRLAGSDRYATAAAISEKVYPAGASAVYVVTGEHFPDALSVGPAAVLDNAPILLVQQSSVPTATAAELRRLSPSKILVVGGTAVISNGVIDLLRDLVPATVSRVAGPDRYATAAALSRGRFDPDVEHVVLVTGEAYPDGLAAGSVAAKLGSPVLLTEAAQLPGPTRIELERLSPGVVLIVGGPDAVSASIASDIENLGFDTERIWGTDRYRTAAALADTFFDPGIRRALVATGEAFPDALSGVAAAGSLDSPLLLTRTESLPPSTSAALRNLFS